MPYAIMQKELEAPSVEQMVTAFRALPTFTGLDAQTAVRDAFGILWRGLELEEASILQDALLKQEVAVEVVEESELPVIPPAKIARQIEFLPEHLSLYDPMGRVFNLPWQDLLLMAAGHVRLQQFRRVRNTLEEPPFHGSGISYDTVAGARRKEETQVRLLLEIVLTGGVSRYSLAADEFDFGLLGARQTDNVAHNFALLVEELAQAAPHAGLNRGACLLCKDAEARFEYPSKTAFFEELIWMLWRIRRAASGSP